MGIYYVPDYGAVDVLGSDDSYTAAQYALAEMYGSNRGGIVQFPPGAIKIGTGLSAGQPTYDATHGWGYQFGRQIQGAARGGTTLIAASGMTSPIMSLLGTTAGVPAVVVRDIAFNGNANTGMTNGVVRTFGVAFSEFQNVLVMGATGGSTLCPLGLNISDSLTSTFNHVLAINCDTGIKTQSAGSYGTNQLTFRDLVLAGTTAWGIDLSGGQNVLIEGVDIEGGSGGGIRYVGSAGQFVVRGPVWIEDGAGGSYSTLFDITASYASIEPPTEFQTAASATAIQNRDTTNLTVRNWRLSATCVNASGAVLNKINSGPLTGSGGTTNTWH